MRPKEFHPHSQKHPVYIYKGEKFSEDYWKQDGDIYAGDIPQLIERLENEGEIDVQIITLYRVKGSDNWTENPEEILEDCAEELGIERGGCKKVSMLRVWYVEVPDDCPVSNINYSIGLHRDWVITREDVILPIKSPWEEYYFPDTAEGLVAAQIKVSELQRRSL